MKAGRRGIEKGRETWGRFEMEWGERRRRIDLGRRNEKKKRDNGEQKRGKRMIKNLPNTKYNI